MGLYLGNKIITPSIVSQGSGGGETVTATNNTGSAISKGDKVWVNKEGTDYKLVDFYKKYYNNFYIVGSPSIDRDSGYASGFSGSNYCKLPQAFNPGSSAWEAVVCLSATSIRTNVETHFFGCYTDQNSFVMSLKYKNGLYYATCYLSSNGSSFDIALSTPDIPFSLNTKTWIKLQFTGTQYILSTSTNKIDWTSQTISSSLSIYPNRDVYFGACWIPNNSYLQGTIYLDETYIKVGNDIWWTPAENIVSGNITGDTLTGIADDNFTASSTSLNVNYPGSYVGTILTDYILSQTKASSNITVYKDKSFECIFKVKDTDRSGEGALIDAWGVGKAETAFYIRNGNSRLWGVANPGSGQQYGYTYTIPNINQWYYIKTFYDPSTRIITYSWSYDKISWTTIWSYTFSASTWFYGDSSNNMEIIVYIGFRKDISKIYGGLTDLSECYFKVDDQIVWDGTTFTPGSTGDVNTLLIPNQ